MCTEDVLVCSADGVYTADDGRNRRLAVSGRQERTVAARRQRSVLTVCVLALRSSCSWFFDVVLCLCFAFFLSFLHLFTSRLASFVTLGAGSIVANLNCDRPPKLVLYEAHREAGCRVLRQAISMLGMEVEIRSVPEAAAGVPTPWREDLQKILGGGASMGAEAREVLPLPYLVGIDTPEVRAAQGDGAALAKLLMQMYCLDPKEAFPLDLSPKILKTLATVASHIRAYLPWGGTAHPIAWTRVNEARDLASIAAGVVPVRSAQPSVDQPPGGSPIVGFAPSLSPHSSQSFGGPSSVAPSPASFSSLPTPPLTPRTPFSRVDSRLDHLASPAVSPSVASSGVSEASLKLRAQLERQAMARSTSGTRTLVEEELPAVYSLRDLHPLTVYGSEAHPSCRGVFELLCSLQLPYLLKTCAQGSVHRAHLVMEYGDQWKLPTVVDPNTRRALIGGQTAVEYLLATYTDGAR